MIVEVVRNRLHVQFHVLDVVSVGETVATPRHFSSADNERRELGTVLERIAAHRGHTRADGDGSKVGAVIERAAADGGDGVGDGDRGEPCMIETIVRDGGQLGVKGHRLE